MIKAWLRITIAVVLGSVLGFGAVLVWRVEADGSGQVEAARRDLEQVFGLTVAAAGPIEFHLFPRPEIVAADVKLADLGGGISVDIPTVEAALSIGPLLMGRIVLDTVRVAAPTGTVDFEALLQHWQSNGSDTADWIGRLPSKLIVTSGVVQVQSDRAVESGLLTDLQMAVRGLPEGSVTLNGRGTWHGSNTDISIRLDSFKTFAEGRPTTGFLKAKSHQMSVSINGALAQGRRGGFAGTVVASTPSLPAFLRWGGFPAFGSAGIQHASFSGTAEATDDGVAFSNASLILNATVFEGAVALQRNGGFVGTLATDDLDFTPFLAGFPEAFKADGTWNANTLDFTPSTLHDTDLRISANRIRFGSFRAEDAAISALCRAGRMELSLGEARAYGGLVKARLLASALDRGVQVKVDASASRLNISQMKEVFHLGSDQISGSATAHLTGEGRGESLRSIVASSSGRGQVAIREGRVTGLPRIGQALVSDVASEQDTAAADPVAFDLLTVDGDIDHGTATIRDGAVEARTGRRVLRGELSLADGDFALSSTTPPDLKDMAKAPQGGLSVLPPTGLLDDRTARGGAVAPGDVPGGFFP